MNDYQRSVIQRHFKQLGDDIMMTEDLYGALFQTKIFERHMIDIIKAERTPQEQVYKMLSMLTKRGPEAFDLFIDIIKEDYPWLSAMLETSYKACESLSRQNSVMTTICTCGSVKLDNGNDNPPPIKPTPTEIQADGDIKTKVGQFIHKQFGHSKRISQHDKKTMEKWFSEQIQTERKKKLKEQATIDENQPDMSAETQQIDLPPQPDPVQEKLNQVFNKVRDENQIEEVRNRTQTDKPEDIDEVDGTETEKIKSEELTHMLDKEVDKLINRLNELESQVTQCHYILGDHDNKYSLPDLVRDATFMKRQYELELGKEKAKSEKMLTELYDYCKSISKLENVRKTLRHELDKNQEQINSLKLEKAALAERCRILDTEKLQHLEKEKTIENLRKMIQDLKQTTKPDENANYKSSYGLQRPYRRPVRPQGRRGSVDQGVINNSSSPFRKTGIKPTVNTLRRKQTMKY